MNTKRSIFCVLFVCCQLILATTLPTFAFANTTSNNIDSNNIDSNNIDSSNRQVERPQETQVDLTIEISVNPTHLDGQGNTAPGGVLEYQFTVQNKDVLAYQNVILSTIVPDYTKFDGEFSQVGWALAVDATSATVENISSGCPQDAGPNTQCTFELGTIDAGESATVTFAVNVDKPIFVEETIFNLLASVTAQHPSNGLFTAAEEFQVGLSTPTAIQEVPLLNNQLYLPFIGQ